MRKQKGQSEVEFALILPLLVLILLGCLDLGRVFSVWLALHNATREGARYVAVHAPINSVADDSNIEGNFRQRVVDEAAAAGVTLDSIINVDIQGVDLDKNVDGKYDGTSDEGVGGLSIVGNPVTVSAYCTMTLMTFNLLGGGPVTIRATNRMPIIVGFSAPTPIP